MFALLAEYPHVLAMSWPNRFPKRGMSCPERALVVGRALALSTKPFVVNGCGTLPGEMRELLVCTEEDRAALWDDRSTGGSCIVGPSRFVVAGLMGVEEGTPVYEADLNECVSEKIRYDFAGHYNRPDVFQLRVRARAPDLRAQRRGRCQDQVAERRGSDDGRAGRVCSDGGARGARRRRTGGGPGASV
ncbi:MAG: hypothetical protein C4303_09585 [candidate division GAL15 bacterium]